MEVMGGWNVVHGQWWDMNVVKMTPQPKSIIQNVVPLGQNWLDFGSNWARIRSRFHSKMGHFELEFHSIFIDFLWIYYQFSVIFSQFWAILILNWISSHFGNKLGFNWIYLKLKAIGHQNSILARNCLEMSCWLISYQIGIEFILSEFWQ